MKTKHFLISALMTLSSAALSSQVLGPVISFYSSVYKRGTTYLESTLPPSPEAASAVKFVDVPFIHSMGAAQLDIPFYTLNGREFSIPIGLSYTSTGIKMDEIASVAGLGWNLTAGGCITRTVMDLPDEFSMAGFTHQLPSTALLAKLEDPNNTDVDKHLYLHKIIYHQIDSKLDRYSYNVCGLSGSFVILDNGQVYQLSGDGVCIYYTRALSNEIISFQITGPDGTKYYLEEMETGTHNGTNGQVPSILTGQEDIWTATTAWYVSSIESRSGLETAEFTYSSGPVWSKDVVSHTTSVTVTSSSAINTFSSGSARIIQSYTTKKLDSISFCGETVSFNYSQGTGSNYHLGVAYDNYPVRLTDITVKAENNNEIKKLHLNTLKDSNDGRIVLQSLTFKGIGDDTYDTWSFTYNTRSQHVSHYAQDWFGYYNGQTSGYTDCAPFHFVNGISTTSGAPNANEACYMSLTEFNHNGAISHLQYEGSTVGNYSVGIRVKSILNIDDATSFLADARIRSFSYNNPIADGPTSPSYDMYATMTPPLTLSDMNLGSVTWTFTFHESPVTNGPSIRDTKVYYAKVTELIGSNQLVLNNPKLSKTVRYYDTSKTHKDVESVYSAFPSSALTHYVNCLPYVYGLTPFDCVRTTYTDEGPVCAPVLTRQEEYAWDASGESKLVSAINYTYDNPSRESVLLEYVATNVWQSTGVGNYTIFHYPIYATNCSQRNKLSESHVQYHPDGRKDSTLIAFTYLSRGTNLENPSRIQSETIIEGGETRKVEYEYADCSDESFASALEQQHCICVPLSKKYYLTSPLLFFQNWLKLWKKECFNYSTFNISGQKLLPSSHVEYTDDYESWREEVYSRDDKGNIQQIKEKGKPNTVILWSYYGKYPVAIIENATLSEVTSNLSLSITELTNLVSPSASQILAVNSLRSTLPLAHVTTYTFDPGVGMTSITDASGVKTSFEYDFAGRLTAVKDADGHLVQGYEYDLLDSDGDGRLSVLSKKYRTDSASQYTADKTWWNTLGLKQQDIAFGASGDGRDLVTAYGSDYWLHDDVKTWMPYPVNNTGGAFQTGAASSAAAYHDNAKAYFYKGYEISGRDKVMSTALPGYEGAHENSESDDSALSFPKYKWETFGISTETPYSDWEIHTTTTTDADGRIKTEFKDHFGRLLGTSIGTDTPTYYIYDTYDQLRAVVGSGIAISDTLNIWRYSYDELGRLSSKGIPGSVRECYEYDSEDRIVSIIRDGVIKDMVYDAFGRVVQAYLTNDDTSHELIEEHSYDSYPASIPSQLASYVNAWNGPSKNLETFTSLALIDESGQIDGYAHTVHLFDGKARPLKNVTMYADGGILCEDITYNFAGEIISKAYTYSNNGQTDTFTEISSYDVRGRKVTGSSSLLADGYSSVSIGTAYSYDALGRPSGCMTISGGSTLTSSDSYTLQGWLSNHNVQLGSTEIFNEDLEYDSGSNPSYTGMITAKEEIRDGQTDVISRNEYLYDYAGRLSRELTCPPQLIGTRYLYDPRGNISIVYELMIPRFSQHISHQYNYSGDRLVSINDMTWDNVTESYSFTYDNLARMTSDGLSELQMEYNDMDLLAKVGSQGTTLVNYCYLADGTKTSSLKSSGEGLVYRGPFVYRRSSNGTLSLESVACSKGRLTPTKALLYITDHLGSVRTVIDGSTGAELETSDYSAYGTRSGSTSATLGNSLTLRDHFTGQEDQHPDFTIPYSDHGARQYNPTLRRWMIPDPLSEKYYGLSPYNYCGGNPVSIIDEFGLDITIIGSNSSSVSISFDKIDKTFQLSKLGIDYDFGGNFSLSGDDVLSAFLDIVGLFDPSGIADGTNALLQFNKGDYLGAGISLLSIAPIVGDVAKISKVGKDVKLFREAINSTSYSEKITNALRSEKYGSYTIYFQSGFKYHGKGPYSRMEQSARFQSKHHNDKVVSREWAPSYSETQSFIDEAKRIRKDGGVGSEYGNYNKINSPGEKLLKSR